MNRNDGSQGLRLRPQHASQESQTFCPGSQIKGNVRLPLVYQWHIQVYRGLKGPASFLNRGFNNAPKAADSMNSNPSKNLMRILNAEKVREQHRQKRQRRRQEDSQDKGEFSQALPAQPKAESSKAAAGAPSLQIREGESLKAFSRRAEEALRGDINSAMRSASKKSNKDIDEDDPVSKKRKRQAAQSEELKRQRLTVRHQPVDQRIAEKRAKAAERAGQASNEPLERHSNNEQQEFQGVPRLGVNDIVQAPPSLDKFTKKQRQQQNKKKGAGGAKVGLSLAQQVALEKQRQQAIQRYDWFLSLGLRFEFQAG